ncbi:Nudix hydrolase 15 [Abeliophyllum distichum]|uniref:Nudix hydrolase 15 n=1 Tax=Abeliophyllum distichum TaxID=126358 RepID=A0ABD1UI67_9LAMI
MNSDRFERSQKLRILADRLIHYKSDPKFDIPNDQTPTNPRIQDPLQNSESLSNPNSIQSERVEPNRAAVLICLFEGEKGDIRVILTKRSSTLSSHSGEVALPGGKVEEGDASDADTALKGG